MSEYEQLSHKSMPANTSASAVAAALSLSLLASSTSTQLSELHQQLNQQHHYQQNAEIELSKNLFSPEFSQLQHQQQTVFNKDPNILKNRYKKLLGNVPLVSRTLTIETERPHEFTDQLESVDDEEENVNSKLPRDDFLPKKRKASTLESSSPQQSV